MAEAGPESWWLFVVSSLARSTDSVLCGNGGPAAIFASVGPALEFSTEADRRLAAAEGRVYYEHRLSKETRWALPVSHAPCRRCGVALVSR